MAKKSILKKAEKVVRRLGSDIRKSPLARAARGKHTRGYL
jgi:hypothetical protein